ncbi:hypothetical protein JVU11DRAFT_500 [Chiua virens]|nr:hypothetical protein JVU11DRAFT_500 [Chiua virens]
MSDHSKVAIFWDYENCSPPSTTCGLGYDIVNNIGRIARIFGSITTFRAYLDISAQSSKSAVVLRSELQSSGVSMIDCPHNGKKDVVDKMILVDMLAFAVDHPAPATIILIAGDRDYAYAVSVLKLRKYHVILVVPASPNTSPSLENQASLVVDWATAATYADLDANLVARLLRELQEFSIDDNALHSYATPSQGISKVRRISARDLLEPSKHAKNASSFDFAQDLTHTPASPRKYPGAGSDLVPGGLPVPRTPSRSRRASVSTASTRARSATIVASSPPALDQHTPTRNPPPSTARRSSTSAVTDVASPTTRKRSPPVLPPLEAFELPLDDDCPLSSIVIRSPLDPSRSTGDVMDPGKLATSPSHKLSCLAPPFVMARTPFELESVHNPCGKQLHTTVKPTSPIKSSTKTVNETTTACGTPQMKDLRDIDDLTGIQDNVGNSERPHQAIRDAVISSEMAKSNCHSYSAPHARDSPSNSSMGLHLIDTPSSNHVSPPAAILGVQESAESTQFSTFANMPNTLDHTMGLASPLTPMVTESREHNEVSSFNESKRRQEWAMFKPLVYLLLAAQEKGIARPLRSPIAVDLVLLDKQVYQRAGVSRFREYTALAEQANIIELGGTAGDAWIALHPNWFMVDGITAAHDHVLSISSPTLNLDPPNVIQNALLMGSRTPLIERAEELFQTPTTPANTGSGSTSSPSNPRSHESGHTFAPAPPAGRQNLHGGSTGATVVPASFHPLVDFLVRSRAEGSQQILRSVVGQQLNQEIYAQAGVSSFKDYIHKASEAHLVQIGGLGGWAWIGLHPDLRI